MCGICGYVGDPSPGLLASMSGRMVHRGPDDSGSLEREGVGLGFRRLSIIDLAGGHQPIPNEDETIHIVFNGEIYNYVELRGELEARGHRFRTRTDTEVILHLYEDMGPDCLKRLNGMWAIAIWDESRKRLFLARDRLGIKPLYYARHGRRLLFASELKALITDPELETSLDPTSVREYLALRYVPGPGTLFREVQKLPAASYAIVEDGQLHIESYWEPQLYDGPFDRSDESYLEEFAERFRRSVRRRLMAEVPYGAYLSGGVDSGAIVGTMSELVSEPVHTFTVAFEFEHDEREQAREAARRLGCVHTEVDWRPADVELMPDIVWHLDEPIGDPIVIPMYRLAEAAKKEVTVILAGEGADELLGGYAFHRALMMGHRLARATPRWFRRGVLRPAAAATPAALLDLAFDYPAALGRRGKQKVLDYLDLVEPERLPDAYRHLISLFDSRDTEDLFASGFPAANGVRHAPSRTPTPRTPYLNRIIDLQFAHWLPEDILTKQDKMSMAHGIEARVPFLDHELVEFMLRLPPRMKLRGKTTKYVLRRYAESILPPAAARRRKMPFYAPLELFVQLPAFQDMVADTLSERQVRDRGIFSPTVIAGLRETMLQGEFMHVKQVFSLVAFELWCRAMLDRKAVAV